MNDRFKMDNLVNQSRFDRTHVRCELQSVPQFKHQGTASMGGVSVLEGVPMVL